MAEAYAYAFRQLDTPLEPDDLILDCGAGAGQTYHRLANTTPIRDG